MLNLETSYVRADQISNRWAYCMVLLLPKVSLDFGSYEGFYSLFLFFGKNEGFYLEKTWVKVVNQTMPCYTNGIDIQ